MISRLLWVVPFLFIGHYEMAEGSNILVMLPFPFYSHSTNFMTVFKELAKRGHNVTCVSPYPQKKPLKNWTDIVVDDITPSITGAVGAEELTKMAGWHFDMFGLWTMFPFMTEKILQEEPVQRIIKDSTSSYDLIITETYFSHEVFAALSHKYKAPLVSISAAGVSSIVTFLTGNHYPPAYVPNYKFPYTDRMTFLERAKNAFFNLWETYGVRIYYHRQMDALMRKYVVYPGSEDLPYIEELLKQSSLTLLESHLGLHYPRPLHRNLIEVGGINLRDGDKLPDDIQKFMDDATNGVIYFSLGSYFKTSNMNTTAIEQVISAFGKLKQKVIMKWETPNMPNRPENVYIGKWLPQASILGHPNCRLFVTHGGIHGLTEGLYHGVPLLGLPLFADQKFNVKFIEKIGAGLQMELNSLTEESFLSTINTLLENPSYKSSAQLRKRILRDNPISVLDNAIYWIEYVIRFKGAPHLKPEGSLELYWYQHVLLDVAAFFALLALLCLIILVVLVKIIIKLVKLIFCRKNKSKMQSAKGKKSKKE